jgi:hypothetical protein
MALGLYPTKLHQTIIRLAGRVRSENKKRLNPMKTTKSLNITILTLVGLAFAGMPLLGQIPAVDLSSSTIDAVGGSSGSELVGWQFTVNSPISVTDLGLYCGDLPFGGPAPDSGMVGLWASSGTLLASVNVQTSDAMTLGFKYHEVPSTLLNVGQNYIVAALLPPSGSRWFASGTSGAIFSPEISWVARSFIFASDLSSAPTSDIWPDGGPIGFFAASFEYTTIPEPSTFTLLGLAAAALMVCRRHQR